MTESPDKGYEIVIEQAVLQVKFIDVSAATISAHAEALLKGDALYYYTISQITPISQIRQQNFS